MDIGLQIKKFREQQKISQEELALKIFVSRQTISNWETNKSCPDVKSLITLSNIILSAIISKLLINQYKASPKGATKAIEIDIIGIIQEIIIIVFINITIFISFFS